MRECKAVQVLIVDDHPLFRSGLAGLIDDDGGYEVVGEASSIGEAVTKFKRLKPQLITLDLNLSDGNGLSLIKRLRALDNKVSILVVSMHDELLFGERALQAGANGYVSKEQAINDLIKALHEIQRSGSYVSDRLSKIMSDVPPDTTRAKEPVKPEACLSDRELEVFSLIAQGLNSKKIAGKLCISSKTVDSHREHIKQKFGLTDNTALLQKAIVWNLDKISAD